MFWGGFRGSLALALALGIPDSVPYRAEILTVTFGVVAFSVFAQGLTITPLLRMLGQLSDLKVDVENFGDPEKQRNAFALSQKVAWSNSFLTENPRLSASL